MKSILVASLLVLSSIGLFAEVGDTKGVFDAEKAWIDASGKYDVNALGKMMRDDFVGVNPDGVVQSLREYLIALDKTPAAEKEARAKVKPTVSTVRFRMYGETAVVTGAISYPAPQASSRRFTHIWVKSGDNWYLCTAHVSNIAEPKPAGKPVKIIKSPKVS